MLIPANTTSHVRLPINDNADEDEDLPFFSIARFKNLKAINEQVSTTPNGSKYLIGRGRARSLSDASDGHHTNKKVKTENGVRPTKFQRVITHTWHIEAHRKGQRASRADPVDSDDLRTTARYNVQLDECLSLYSGDTHLASLPDENNGYLFKAKMKQGHRARRNWYSAAVIAKDAGLAQIHTEFSRHEANASSSNATGFHFRLRVHVYLDMNNLSEMKPDLELNVARLLHAAFIENRPTEADAAYVASDIDWFYANLKRPGGGVPDRKGKRREQAPLDRDLFPPGLNPTLLPFQCRSVEWMLRREGKRISDEREAGCHVAVDLAGDDASDASRGSLWHQICLDDGDVLWLHGITMEVSQTDPAASSYSHAEGSIAAEEMGLGKTVEVLSLILLNQQPDRCNEPPYLLEDVTAMVYPTAMTLIVCPQAIVAQWADEIARHAPSLKVLNYTGIDKNFPKRKGHVDIPAFSKSYDVVLTTFDVLRTEVKIARKPVLHTTRGNRHLSDADKVQYRRSLLIQLDWLRVVIDEAQMVASTTSAISEMASLIPRKYSWCVSGTPIKENIDDLAGLLKFLRVEYVGVNPSLFERLLQPSFVRVFTTLVSRIAIRTTKQEISDELTLPPQDRQIVPIDFSALESFNYRNRYNDALTDLGLTDEPAVLLARVGPDWDISSTKMSRWLQLMRQACFHALAGAAAEGAARRGGQRLGGKQNDTVQTLEEVLYNLRDRTLSDLHTDQRNIASARVDRAYRLMYDKEDCERYETAIRLLASAKRDLHHQAEDIYNEMLRVLPKSTRSSPASDISERPLDGHLYLAAFRSTVKEAIENATEDTNDHALSSAGRRAGILVTRLRENIMVMHQAVFFTGNAYFALGNKEEAETAAYAEAERLRQQILRSEEETARRAVTSMNERLGEKAPSNNVNEPGKRKTIKKIGESDVTLPLSDIEPGLQSANLFETIKEMSESANGMAKLMMRWRREVIQRLNMPLTDKEVSAEEYQSKAEEQELLDVYMEFLSRIISDWYQVLTGTRSALADNVALGGIAGTDGVAAKDITAVDLVPEGQSRRSLYKKKMGMASGTAAAIIAAATPGGKLRVELDAERTKLLPENAEDNLRAQLRALGQLKERVLHEEEQDIITLEQQRLRIALNQVTKIYDRLLLEVNALTKAYNGRIAFFRAVQIIGDSVAELPSAECTPYALAKSMDELQTKETALSQGVVAKIARRRFLDNLRDREAGDVDECLICSDTGGRLVLTFCAHLFHENCLKAWCNRAGSRSCPVCRSSVRGEHTWQRVHLKGVDAVQEPAKDDAARQVQEDIAMPSAESRDETNDPRKKLNYMSPEDVESIQKVVLQGEALGSKLDLVVKHVLFLRNRHEDAILEASQDSVNNTDRTTKKEAKILIYSGWKYACDVLASAFARQGVGFVRLEGGAGSKNRTKDQAVLEFNEKPDVSVFILHAQSQAAGLNLTAAQYVILVEPLLQTALEVQAIARVHRIGQKQATTVFQYVVSETVDERIAFHSLRQKGHMLFSRVQTAEALNAPAVPPPSPTKSKQSKGIVEQGIDVIRDIDEDDVAKMLLDDEPYAKLQQALVKRAAERHRVAEDDRVYREWEAQRLGSEELEEMDFE